MDSSPTPGGPSTVTPSPVPAAAPVLPLAPAAASLTPPAAPTAPPTQSYDHDPEVLEWNRHLRWLHEHWRWETGCCEFGPCMNANH